MRDVRFDGTRTEFRKQSRQTRATPAQSVFILILCVIPVLPLTDTNPATAHTGTPRLARTTNASGAPLRSKINIGNISSWYDADGTEEINSETGNSGLIYPKGTAGAIFTSGLMWSGLHHDGMEPLIRTNGHRYRTGLQPGAIIGERTGMFEDPDAPDVRIWRIRKDFGTADLSEDAADVNQVSVDEVTSAQIDEVKSRYELDWIEWPAHKGAPFYDANGNGLYEPVITDGEPILYPDADEPGLAGADQVIWYVANDLPEMGSPWGGFKAGLEMQETIWAYERTDPLGDAVFKRYRLIYKGMDSTSADAYIDSMYMGKWSDPDLGSFSDDYSGSDSVLSLGFCYNGVPVDPQFEALEMVPPAIGYTIVQGPLVNGFPGEDRNRNGVDDGMDTGIFDLRETQPGLINLPLTSFVFFAAGGFSDPPFNSLGGLQHYCQLKGRPPTPQPPPCPGPPTDPFSGLPAGKFWLYDGSDGFSAPNPLAPTGWVDGQIDGPGDRRFIMGMGPFTLAVGDTQEMALAVVAGLGNDYLNSITRVKSTATLARVVYQDLFNLPGPPATPSVQAIGFDREILLDWEFDEAAVARVEDNQATGQYFFEGYKVYQYPDESFDSGQAMLIAQFDAANGVTTIAQLTPDPNTGELFMENVVYGTDNGIRRTFAVSIDTLRDGGPIVNGRFYYFGVSAFNYTYNSGLQVRTYESPPAFVTAQAETPKPGTRYPYSIDDTVASVIPLNGSSDIPIVPVVYNPVKQSGQNYFLWFDTTSAGDFTWSLKNVASTDTLFNNVMNLNGDTTYRLTESGIDLTIGPIMQGVTSIHDEEQAEIFGTVVLSYDSTLSGFGGTSETTGEDYEIRFGEESFVLNRRSPSFFSGAVRVPFTVYDVGRGPDDPARVPVMAVLHDYNSTSEWDYFPDTISIGTDLFRSFEPISGTSFPYVPDVPGTPEREDSTAVKLMQTLLIRASDHPYQGESPDDQAFYSLYLVDVDHDSLPPASGSIRINKYHEVRHDDQFEISLERVTTGDVNLARGDVSTIKAYPNPFYGLNADETPASGAFITFNHLPAKAVIRIYNLAGIHVRKLEKDDPQTQYYRWDLKNEHNGYVGSGIYIAYLELRDENGVDLGTKILKLAIIAREM